MYYFWFKDSKIHSPNGVLEQSTCGLQVHRLIYRATEISMSVFYGRYL